MNSGNQGADGGRAARPKLVYLVTEDWYFLSHRLPMALGFAGLVAGTLADRALRLTWLLLAVLVGVGTGVVVYWAVRGNLAPYIVMQAGFIVVAIAATALIRSPYSHAGVLYAAVVLYAAAIVCERLDHPINAALGSVVSGHTLKHLAAAAAAFVVCYMLLRRTLKPAELSGSRTPNV